MGRVSLKAITKVSHSTFKNKALSAVILHTVASDPLHTTMSKFKTKFNLVVVCIIILSIALSSTVLRKKVHSIDLQHLGEKQSSSLNEARQSQSSSTSPTSQPTTKSSTSEPTSDPTSDPTKSFTTAPTHNPTGQPTGKASSSSPIKSPTLQTTSKATNEYSYQPRETSSQLKEGSYHEEQLQFLSNHYLNCTRNADTIIPPNWCLDEGQTPDTCTQTSLGPLCHNKNEKKHLSTFKDPTALVLIELSKFSVIPIMAMSIV